MADSESIEVLFICTGNVCRTPMATGVFNDRAHRFGLSARASSVGLWREGEPATPHGVTVMAERGIDTSSHRSRVMSVEHLEVADLIVGLAREHVREAAVLMPGIVGRSFTLKELVRRGEREDGGRRADEGESVAAWSSRLTADRTIRDLLGADDADDVADPIGRPLRAYRATADEIVDLVDRMVTVLFPRVDVERESA